MKPECDTESESTMGWFIAVIWWACEGLAFSTLVESQANSSVIKGCPPPLSFYDTHLENLSRTPAAFDLRRKFKFKFKLSFIVIPLHVGTYSGTKCRASQDHGAT